MPLQDRKAVIIIVIIIMRFISDKVQSYGYNITNLKKNPWCYDKEKHTHIKFKRP